jgi:predicted DNA-binding transcriptional regulator AlpA
MPERWPYDTLSEQEVTNALGIKETALSKLVKEKKFPPGIPMTAGEKIKRWLWKDVECYLHLQSRIVAGKDDEEPGT